MDRLGIDARRIGTALLGFGVVGAVLAGVITAGLLAGWVSARSLEDRLTGGRESAVEALQAVSTSLGHASETLTNLATTLDTTKTTLEQTSATLGSLADTSAALADGLDFSVLGQQPLAGAAERFAALAQQLRAYATSASTLGGNLEQNRTDLTAMATDMAALQAQIDRAIAALDDGSSAQLATLVSWGILLLAALAGWVAVAAAGCAWLGWRLRRIPGTAATTLGAGNDGAGGAAG